MSINRGTIFPSVSDQRPRAYWTLDDPFPQYVQVQRTLATISGTTINFKTNSFDPNGFMRSKAYIKLAVRINKQIRDPVAPNVVADSDYDDSDRIYKKSGMVLHNACSLATVRLNSHTMEYRDLRYIQRKLNMSFAGKKINNNYMSTSGSNYEELNGVYNEHGNIFKVVEDTNDVNQFGFVEMGFVVGAGNNSLAFTQATNTLVFAAGAGAVVNLFQTQVFKTGDFITDSVNAHIFIVIATLNLTTLLVTRIDGAGNVVAQDLQAADTIDRESETGYNADDGRQHAYDDARKDITLNDPNSTFNFVEALSFGPFNHLADYGRGEVFSRAWNTRQSPLIPYVRELEISMTFKDIAANALVFPYGRSADIGNDNSCQLVDSAILSAELILFWVKPRDELLLSMPSTVRIQSWMYDHRQFPLVDEATGAAVIASQALTTSEENNQYTHQVPSYIMYYGMVDKDSDSYLCRAVNTDTDAVSSDQVLSEDANSVESGMHPLDGITSSIAFRSNTLGGDTIFDEKYSLGELYRITLKNSCSDFPYNKIKFTGMSETEALFCSYPSEFYFLTGEQDLNSFFIRKGQLQTANVMNFSSVLVAGDGYSISKNADTSPNTNGGTKVYALHIIYIYDRYYIELSSDGKVDSTFDAQFF